MPQEQMTLTVGAQMRDPYGEHYEIEGLLGVGGFGAVYLVRGRHDRQRQFALKEVIDPNKRERERFIFEAGLLERLDHRALPCVYQVFEHDKLKRAYMLMDYIQGKNLETLRQEQPEQRFSLPMVVALMAPIVDALIYMHQQDPPIVHRDIKPENIIVPPGGGEAVLVDFSIAKEYVAEKTTSIIRHGSPGYAALEQYGHGTTPRTDIYGLAATIYTLLTGVVPPDVITRASAGQGADPLETANMIVPDIPFAVCIALERAMSLSSNDRTATIEEFWQEVTAHVSEQQKQLPTTKIPQPLTDPAQARTGKPLMHATVQPQHHPLRARKYRTFLPIVLVLLLIIIGTSLLSYALVQGRSPSTPQKVSSTTVTSTSTQPPKSSVYPILAASYAGTVVDLMAKEETTLFLTQIQQNQGNIRGYFQGLGLVGPFTGTITSAGHVHFMVTVQSGNSALLFEGDIKIGGDIVGSFKVLDQRGQSTGETGLWNVTSST